MTAMDEMKFKEIWFVDFEFYAPSGERPSVICMVALELISGKKLCYWQDELYGMKEPPYGIGSDSLFVAYYASAEMGCHLSLDWSMPENILDLFTEFRVLTNGLKPPCGSGLLGALAWFGLGGSEVAQKESMRQLAMRGGPWTPKERDALLNYCESDVVAPAKLFPAMREQLDLPRALLRGRYMKAAARIEFNGVPIDVERFTLLKEFWEHIQSALIDEIDGDYGVFEGRSFKAAKFSNWLTENEIPWPVLGSGKLDLKDDTFKEMSRSHPKVSALRELRTTLSQMRLSDLAVGSDGRNRPLLSAFRSSTGRNQPSNSRSIFGPAVWLRGLIRPESGYGIAYIDWSQQEFGIAAALSKDPLMMKAYLSGDPYLSFGKQAGVVPENATKKSHGPEREQLKQCVLAVQYGMGEISLAIRIKQPVFRARELLRLHRETYKIFWDWSDSAVDYAMLYGELKCVLGWTVHVGANVNPRFLRNFPMQANGAEMLRIACCMVTERGIKLCAPIHDALLIEAPLKELEMAVETTQQIMEDASSIILEGFKLRSDVEIVTYPDRYMDKRGEKMWETVETILNKLQAEQFEEVVT